MALDSTDILYEKTQRHDVGEISVEMDFKSSMLTEIFGVEAKYIDGDSKTENGHDDFNKKAHEAEAGWNGASYTAAAASKRLKEQAEIAAIKGGTRSFANITADNLNMNLIDVALDNLDFVKISSQGILMVRGEGADSEFRSATLDEKLQLEEESHACSIGITEQEIEINAYLRGDTDIVPDALKEMAEEKGLLADDLTREDFNQILAEKYADSPHIYSRITSGTDLGSNGTRLDKDGLLPSPTLSTVPAAESGIADISLQSPFKAVATTQDGPQSTPAPAPEPAPELPAPSMA